ncbi:hypothetical protein GYMLUDRAFT_44000 [Collybiopsis luxurians FD-317 M1]|uniref:DUF6534 domain-containing protein n=1 Tax=Collybiopsis luxurians FD-317 M1 TaxID=944289 RepID=A0A0D0CMW1_9AGAR|nr:hypothetical protein GYMLUDRAFT_44000 [Collybiopsis luxurians FD-317 M1]
MATQATSLGAIIIGTPLALLFTGVLIVQCIIYWKTARAGDTWRTETLVISLLLMDLLHSVFLWTASWRWFITDRGQDPDKIPITLPLSIFVTSISTLMAHSMYSWRIFKLTHRNYWITFPIITLAVLRVVSAIFTGTYMIHLKSFVSFRSTIGWVFSLGLGLSCTVDILITSTMMYILKQSRAKSLSLDTVIDSLIIYTLENGAVTALATVVSLICWVSMRNLIFLSLYFVIAKLYANSVLAMLNYRPILRRTGESTSRSGGAVDLEVIRFRNTYSGRSGIQLTSTTPVPAVEVNVNKTMQMHTDSVDDVNPEFKG